MAQLSGVVTDEGQAEVVDILHEKAGGAAAESFHHAGWGTGTTPADVTDTLLANDELSRLGDASAPLQYTHELPTSAVSQPDATTLRFDFTLHGATLSASEVGLFDGVNVSTPDGVDETFLRVVHTTRDLIGGDRIHYTIDVTFADVVLAEFADGSAAEFADGATIEFA